MKKSNKPFALALICSFLLSLGLGCNPNDESGFGPSNNQQIFGDWQMSELSRSGCDDANNNIRRPCNDCYSLAIRTDNTFELTNDNDELIVTGTYRVTSETDITFDPGIFNSTNVSSVRYDLFTGALKFSYQDANTLCNVIESYLTKTVVGGGN